MKLHLQTSSFQRRARRWGMTLVEIMVAVGLLVVITTGLTLMFGQTQRAFKSSIAQVDVLEGSRAAFDLIVRDLEQITPVRYPGLTNIIVNYSATVAPDVGVVPVGDLLPDKVTPVLQDVFFLSEHAGQRHGSVYWLSNSFGPLNGTKPSGIGTLYFHQSEERGSARTNLTRERIDVRWTQAVASFPKTNYPSARIMDGVVHFRVRPYAANGEPYPFRRDPRASTPIYQPYPEALTNRGFATRARTFPEAFYFNSNSFPAFLEVELGVLEPQVVEQARALPTLTAVNSFLTNHAEKIHIFRQLVPLRCSNQ
jgi:type II secretory pathway pseudopilin PulG